jgi:AhpD family alkylhydroperoxidase
LRFDVYTADPNGSKRLLAWGQHVSASLDEATHALIETRVSQINGCAVCLMMHADAARRAGVPQDKLDALAAWRDDPSFTDRERAGLELAEAMTRLADGGARVGRHVAPSTGSLRRFLARCARAGDRGDQRVQSDQHRNGALG